MRKTKVNKMRKIIYIVVFLFIAVSVSAMEYDNDKNISINVPCVDQGEACSSSAVCNLTVLYPDSSILLNNSQMDNEGSIHTYDLGITEITGTYSASVYCADEGTYGHTSFEFDVNDPKSSIEINKCPSSLPSAIMLGLFILIIIATILFAEVQGIVIMEFLGTVMVFILGWIIAGCSGLYGFAVIGVGVLLLARTVVKLMADS